MKSLCSAFLLLLVAGMGTSQTATAYKAGAASVVITPEKPMWMAGYAARNKPSEGKASDLFAKALALEDDKGNRLVFVTMDLIGIPRTLRKSLETRARTEWKLSPESLVLNASHTHCGPEFRYAKTSADDGEFSRASQGELFGRNLEEKLIKLIGNAIVNLKPCNLSHSFARCGFAMNRRLPSKGDFRNSPYPEGPVDHEVPTLKVSDADGKLKAVLFGYACHNTTLGFYQFCGDYAGFAQQFLEEDHPGAIALFMTGCGGDQNPYPRGTLDLAQKHGRSLATAVEAALANTMKPINGGLRGALEEIDLHYAPAPTKDEFSRRLQSKDTYEAAHARRMLERLEKGEKLPTVYPYPVQVIKLGDDLTMAALGGEVVVDYSLRLKKEIKGGTVWVAGYSNDVMGYIPSARVLKEGGYEGGGAMRFSSTHPGPWADTTEEKIIEKVHGLHRLLQTK